MSRDLMAKAVGVDLNDMLFGDPWEAYFSMKTTLILYLFKAF